MSPRKAHDRAARGPKRVAPARAADRAQAARCTGRGRPGRRIAL
jgi:hypothetical protein